MKLQDRNKAWGFTLFGDDLRAEVGGKVSLMGLYQSDMFFPTNVTFPVTVPRFCLLVMYYEARGSITEDITFKVTLGEESTPLIEFPVLRKDIDASLVEGAPQDDLKPEDKERIFHSRIPMMFSPFQIPRVGRLRVRAHYANGDVLKLGSIAIKQIPLDRFNEMLGIDQPGNPAS